MQLSEGQTISLDLHQSGNRLFGRGSMATAGTTQMALAVQDAMRAFEQHDRANIHRGVHTLSQRATDAFERARSVATAVMSTSL